MLSIKIDYELLVIKKQEMRVNDKKKEKNRKIKKVWKKELQNKMATRHQRKKTRSMNGPSSIGFFSFSISWVRCNELFDVRSIKKVEWTERRWKTERVWRKTERRWIWKKRTRNAGLLWFADRSCRFRLNDEDEKDELEFRLQFVGRK